MPNIYSIESTAILVTSSSVTPNIIIKSSETITPRFSSNLNPRKSILDKVEISELINKRNNIVKRYEGVIDDYTNQEITKRNDIKLRYNESIKEDKKDDLIVNQRITFTRYNEQLKVDNKSSTIDNRNQLIKYSNNAIKDNNNYQELLTTERI